MESFRRSGSLKLGLTQFRDEDAEDGDVCWFDGVAAALLGCRFSPGIEQALETAKTWKLGDNPAQSLRTAQLPLEAYCVEAAAGADFSDSIAPAAIPTRISAEPTESPGGKASAPTQPTEVLDSQESPSPDVVLVDKVDQVPNNAPIAVPVPSDPSLVTAIDGLPPLEQTVLGSGASVSPADAGVHLPFQDAISPSAAISVEGQRDQQESGSMMKPGDRGVLVRPVLFADPSSEKLSFDIDIVETAGPDRKPSEMKTLPASSVERFMPLAEPQLLKESEQRERTKVGAIGNGVVRDIQTEKTAPVELKHDPTEAAEVPCNVRQDAPTTLLQELLDDMNDENDGIGRIKGKLGGDEYRGEAPMDVGNAGPGNEKEKEHGISQASRLRRVRKRKLSTQAVHEKQVIEERRDRMKAAVMETLQGEAENKKKLIRSSALAVNGQRSPRVPRGREFQRRSSRRTRRLTMRTVDSSSSESIEMDNDDDEEFVPLEEGIAQPTLPQRTTNVSPPVHSPSGPSDGKVFTSPRKRSDQVVREVAGPRARPATTRKPDAAGRDETGAIIVLKQSQATRVKEKVQNAWDAEIRRIERLFDANEDASPTLSSAEDDSDLEPFDGLPLVERLVHNCLQENRDVLHTEPFDEHGEMMRFYKETRNEPAYAPSAISPGTQFVEESWRRSAYAVLDAEPHAMPTVENDNLGEGNMVMATIAASAETQVKAAVGPAGSKVESGEASSVKSESSDEEHVGGGGVSRKVQIKAKALRAKELQSRVCGDLLSSMEPEARKRVLRWAEKDYTWFDDGADMMELVGSKTSKPCSHCDSLDGCPELRCEESILLKLWTNMKWRKVRRMRHRVRGPIA